MNRAWTCGTGIIASIRDHVSRFTHRCARLRSDRSGASAVEFAFLAPIMIGLYISSFEITTGYTEAGKVLNAAGSVADIVARQTSVNKSFLSEMVDTAEATIAPNSTVGLTLKISGITIDSAGNASVLWSWNQDGNAPYTVGTVVTVPSDLDSPSTFLIHAEISVPHTMMLFLGSGTGFATSTRNITISRDFYYRQRLGDEIACSDCS